MVCWMAKEGKECQRILPLIYNDINWHNWYKTKLSILNTSFYSLNQIKSWIPIQAAETQRKKFDPKQLQFLKMQELNSLKVKSLATLPLSSVQNHKFYSKTNDNQKGSNKSKWSCSTRVPSSSGVHNSAVLNKGLKFVIKGLNNDPIHESSSNCCKSSISWALPIFMHVQNSYNTNSISEFPGLCIRTFESFQNYTLALESGTTQNLIAVSWIWIEVESHNHEPKPSS